MTGTENRRIPCSAQCVLSAPRQNRWSGCAAALWATTHTELKRGGFLESAGHCNNPLLNRGTHYSCSSTLTQRPITQQPREHTSQPTPATGVFRMIPVLAARCAIQGNLPVPLLRNRSPQVRSRTSPSFLASRLQVKQVQATGNSDFHAHLAASTGIISCNTHVASQRTRRSTVSTAPQKHHANPSPGWHTALPQGAPKTPGPCQCHALQAPW